jgi:hypothetical protein
MNRFQKLVPAAVATVMILTVGLGDVWAQGRESNLPLCKVSENSDEEDLLWNSDSRPRIWNNCFGVRIFGNGDKYIGEFKDGDFHGKGTLTTSADHNYTGDWKEHKKHGYGTSNWGNTWKYEGEHKYGLFSGVGTLTNAHGKFVGEFKNGKKNGRGIETKLDGRRFEGFWVNDDFIRKEKVILPKIKASSQQPTEALVGEKRTNNPSLKLEYPTKFYQKAGNFSEGLAPVQIMHKNQYKWGYIDLKGNLIINAEYDYAESFSEGLARVRIGTLEDGKYGFIDKEGKFRITPIFDGAYDFSDGMAIVTKGKRNYKQKIYPKYGAINKKGELVVNFDFDFIFPFKEGMAPATKNAFGKEQAKWGYINKNGVEVIPPIFDDALVFSEGKAIVGFRDERKKIKHGFINKKGEIVIAAQFTEGLGGFQEGVSWVGVKIGGNTKFGFIDEKGKFVIEPIFDAVGNFSEGLAAVRIGKSDTGTLGFIDKSGLVAIKPRFNFHAIPSKFKDGLAAVEVGKNKGRKFGFIDRNGDFLFPPKYEYATNFNDGLAAVYSDEGGNDWVVGFIKKDSVIQANFYLDISTSEHDVNGEVTINIRTSGDTASLKINGEEQGGRADGNYTIKKVARIGQDTQFTITAIDINGNSDTKTITVSRQAPASSQANTAGLKPENIRRATARDAVAIIIGIQDYKRVPRADYANNDAKEFYEYAVRALGVKPEKIKMLVDDEADEVNVVKAFENWLPIQVNRDKTDVYVFFSGHGLPAPDGKSLYFLPHGVDKDLLSRTAVAQNEVVAALSAAKPRSVTMFIDACYSGQTRAGDVLMANAKPVTLKSDANIYPPNFTVITASANDQISSSSPELKHGIFSFYLMKGMEGEADANQDGKITVGEMQDYLSDKVSRQAMTLNRKQSPQLVGDTTRVLVAR